MRIASLLVLVVALFGCNGKTTPPTENPVVLTAEEAGVIDRYRALKKPAHRERVMEHLNKLDSEEIRQGAWARNLTLAGCVLVGLALVGIALKVLGAL